MTLFISIFKKFKKLWILILIFILIGNLNRFLAEFAGVKYQYINIDLHKALILQHRQNGLIGNWPQNMSVAWVGTSRTLSDYSPEVIKSQFERECNNKEVIFFNLGKIATDVMYFEKILKTKIASNELDKLKVIYFELSPHQIIKMPPDEELESAVAVWDDDFYKAYKFFILKFELYVSAGLKFLLSFTDPVSLNGSFLKKINNLVEKNNINAKTIYYTLRAQSGYSRFMRPDGQVLYRYFIPDKEGANIVKAGLPTDPEDYNQTLSSPKDEKQWQALYRVLELLNKNFKLIVIRPKVELEIYKLENNLMSEVIEKQKQWLLEKKIKYIDFNLFSSAEDFSFVDGSHLDGFESERFNKNFVWPALAPDLKMEFCQHSQE